MPGPSCSRRAGATHSPCVPEDLKRQDLDLEGAIELQAANSIPMFRSMVQSTEGYGHLFITSFAQARTADHERRGILTIWDRYTGHKGYCLQFDKGDIEHMISLEAMRGSYQWIELAEVKYGVDPNTCTFRELAAQLGEQFLMQVMREYADGRIAPNYEVQWAPSTLICKTSSPIAELTKTLAMRMSARSGSLYTHTTKLTHGSSLGWPRPRQSINVRTGGSTSSSASTGGLGSARDALLSEQRQTLRYNNWYPSFTRVPRSLFATYQLRDR